MGIPSQVGLAILNSLKHILISFSVPIASVTGVVLAVTIPTGFPYHGELTDTQTMALELKSKSSLKRVDIVGTLLLLAATVFLITGIEQAGTQYAWRSSFVISLLTLSGIMWLLMLLWSRFITLAASNIEPIFPWRFVQSRIWVGMLLYGIPDLESSLKLLTP